MQAQDAVIAKTKQLRRPFAQFNVQRTGQDRQQANALVDAALLGLVAIVYPIFMTTEEKKENRASS